MIKSDILYLKRQGIDRVTNHTLSTAEAIKFVKIRQAINDAYDQIRKDEDGCREAAGIEDGKEFDRELFALRDKQKHSALTEAEADRLKEMEAILQRFVDFKDEMLKEEITITGTRTMSYDTWRQLQHENAEKEIGGQKVDILSGRAEDLLEGLLWVSTEGE